jgi:hypothetical protein
MYALKRIEIQLLWTSTVSESIRVVSLSLSLSLYRRGKPIVRQVC